MATRKKASKPRDKYAEKLERMEEQVSGMGGIGREMAEDLLGTYVQVFSDYEKLNEKLEVEGLLIENERGGANNRHTVMEKHPAFDMRRNCIAQMADLANKIKKFIKDDDAEAEDEFDQF